MRLNENGVKLGFKLQSQEPDIDFSELSKLPACWDIDPESKKKREEAYLKDVVKLGRRYKLSFGKSSFYGRDNLEVVIK